ncbi:DUF1643 domain-containing protein [Streptomyces mobaraensis]|uniref:DUF1643 domain-containing protein n=1 Tax=Streptomyces mobaraensis TaxID=35621 RepID=A0A5N5VXG4_STRMB|nr:DUF1643 domain-containing protein [Streptomyces mobaraensis]KAB7833552.1 DUF1643 domain-containing protein [Streptomyces mobaraensis]
MLPDQLVTWAATRGLSLREGTPAPGVTGSAVYSPGHNHRYALTRTWGTGSHQTYILLNPAGATAAEDDATVRALTAFATRDGHAGLVLACAYAVLHRHPYTLTTGAPGGDPAVGEHNDELLALLAEETHDIVLAWGVWGGVFPRLRAVETILLRHGARLHCLGTTGAGHPLLPTFLPRNTPLQPYRPPGVDR